MIEKAGRWPSADLKEILQAASVAHREGRLLEAETGYREVLKERPDSGPVLNALGTVLLDGSRREEAREVFERAARLAPPYPPAWYHLGMLKQQQGDHRGAVAIYRALLEREPGFGQAWNNLGVAHRETGRADEALSCFRKAVAFAPDMAEAWNNLGVAQDEFNLTENAATSYRKAIEIQPDYVSAHFNLGVSLQRLGRFAEAAEHYTQVLAVRPDDGAATFMLQSLGGSVTPDAAPVEHVRGIFDRCAGTFERILVKDLEYRTPELLFDLVRPHLSEGAHILDLGCGTGLGAEQYRSFAKSLTGVDVSSKMLEKAAEKKVYDRLEAFDILERWRFPQRFDLIYSADCFVYFGNLDPIIRSAAGFLVGGGLLAFSVEDLEVDAGGYRLFPTGRYAHSRTYLQDCLGRHGLQWVEDAVADIRKQSGRPVTGRLVIARRPEDVQNPTAPAAKGVT